ncbi:MAG: phage antirepressor KilAC domain-containing protein [Micromonosporaceae bacterium]
MSENIRPDETSYDVAIVVPAIDRRALAQMVLDAEDEREAAEVRVRDVQLALSAAAPKVAAHERLMAAHGGLLIREVAKLLGWRERALRAFLLEQRLIFTREALCGQLQYDAYARYAEVFRPIETVVTHRSGDCAHYTLTVLPRGIELIRRRILAQRRAITSEG